MRMKYIVSTLCIPLDVIVQISDTLSDEAALDSYTMEPVEVYGLHGYTYQPSHPGFKQPSAGHPQAPIHRWPLLKHLQVAVLHLDSHPHVTNSTHLEGTLLSLFHTIWRPSAGPCHPSTLEGGFTFIFTLISLEPPRLLDSWHKKGVIPGHPV